MERKLVFKRLLDQFETEEIRAYCEDMIELIPEYIFTMPSSTSYKYHNATQCQEHGQLYHILMFGEIMNYILGLDYVRGSIARTPKERDMLRCTPMFHDAFKCGDGLSGQFTKHEHPLYAATWVKETKVEHDISDEDKETIALWCASHSGQWTTNKKSQTILPAPKDDKSFLVHLCDYLSSRQNIDMIYDVDTLEYITGKREETTKLTPETFVVRFGKYKGHTLKDISYIDPGYIEWCKNNISEGPITLLLKEM